MPPLRRALPISLSSLPSLCGSLAALSIFAVACDSLTVPSEPTAIAGEPTAAPKPTAVPTASAPAPTPPPDPNAKLVSTDSVVGKGAAAKSGDSVSVHYVGTLADGSQFDSSRDRGQPFVFTLGKGMVIPGWDQGIVGMKVGGKRKLVIPPALAYGERGMGPKIPSNSTLTFDVELMQLTSAKKN